MKAKNEQKIATSKECEKKMKSLLKEITALLD